MENKTMTKFEGAMELGKTLLEKVSQSEAGKITLFAAFATTMYGAYKLTLGAMNNNNKTMVDEQ